jgi:predicted RNA binding protein YcfA (HicA-like mRNA interferase family)
MKRQAFIRHIQAHGCVLMREGGKHSVYYNPKNNQTSAIPRHREINNFLARRICRDLGIADP